MKLSNIAEEVLRKRYLLPGETPEGLFKRVADTVMGDEKFSKVLCDMMTNLEFLPNTPTLINAGGRNSQLSACFVLPIEDSMHGIFKTLYDMAMIQKSGGGTGFSFSRLRPKGTVVTSTRGVSSGPISFMRVYNAASEEVEQGGTRRGACMAVMSVYHPDIREFIMCKTKEGELKNFNISVAIDRKFLSAVSFNDNIELVHDGKVYEKVPAKDIMDMIVKQAHKNGEPGILFIDEINLKHPASQFGVIEATNPCGEQPLLPYESCNLGSINLEKCINSRKQFDYDYFRCLVSDAVNFLDKVIDINQYPIPEVAEATLKTRKIGLGVMGFANLLLRLGIPYGSEGALSLVNAIMSVMQEEARDTSILLGKERGCIEGFNRRNAALLTIAPTGSLATIANTSYGIEPIFALTYKKKMVDQVFETEVNEIFLEKLNELKLDAPTRAKIIERVKETGSCANISELPLQFREVFRTATEISWEEHIVTQGCFQYYVDNAVSKTINMPSDAALEDFEAAIFYAELEGCKGLTLYRDRSRAEEAVSIGTREAEVPKEIKELKPEKRPAILAGITERRETPLGNAYMILNKKDDKPFEFFTLIGKAGSDVAAFTEAIARLITLGLRLGVNPTLLASELLDIGGGRGSVGFGANKVKSVPDAMGQFIISHIEDQPPAAEDEVEKTNGGICPACGGASLVRLKGCVQCLSCNFNEC